MPLRLGSFFICRPAIPATGGGAAPILNTAPPVWGRADGAANGEGDDAGAALGAPNAKPPPPFCPGSPALGTAGEAGWLPKAKGFEGVVAVVGVAAPKLNPFGCAGWVNGFGLGAAELVVEVGAPKEALGAITGAPKLKGEVAGAVGVAGELKENALVIGGALVSGAFEPKLNPPTDGVAPASCAFWPKNPPAAVVCPKPNGTFSAGFVSVLAPNGLEVAASEPKPKGLALVCVGWPNGEDDALAVRLPKPPFNLSNSGLPLTSCALCFP